jgi:hypothetical protein
LFALHACDIAADEAATDVMVRDDACLIRQMRPDCARNTGFNLSSGNAHDRSGLLPASRQRRA